jgi:hypothetical protein
LFLNVIAGRNVSGQEAFFTNGLLMTLCVLKGQQVLKPLMYLKMVTEYIKFSPKKNSVTWRTGRTGNDPSAFATLK